MEAEVNSEMACCASHFPTIVTKQLVASFELTLLICQKKNSFLFFSGWLLYVHITSFYYWPLSARNHACDRSFACSPRVRRQEQHLDNGNLFLRVRVKPVLSGFVLCSATAHGSGNDSAVLTCASLHWREFASEILTGLSKSLLCGSYDRPWAWLHCGRSNLK